MYASHWHETIVTAFFKTTFLYNLSSDNPIKNTSLHLQSQLLPNTDFSNLVVLRNMTQINVPFLDFQLPTKIVMLLNCAISFIENQSNLTYLPI
jgi:hypothetical protein